MTSIGTLPSALLVLVNENEIPPDLRTALHAPDSIFRWDWRTRTLYRITDPDLYERRMNAFWTFFERFYHGIPGLIVGSNSDYVRLFSLCDRRIGVAAFNSCYGNDCFALHGMIRQGVVARSDLDLSDSGETYELRMAIWHHSINGSPYRTDYMDTDVVRGMIGRGFRLGLHGHQHRAQATPQEIRLPDRERMAVVSAGSLCAGANDLPVGTHRQYNILEIADDFCTVRMHVRSMTVANLFSRGQLMDFGGASYADLDWDPPRNAVGQAIDTEAIRRRSHIERAETAYKIRNYSFAVELLGLLDLPAYSFERDLYLGAAEDGRNWPAILDVTDPPVTIRELVLRFEVFFRLRDFGNAIDSLDRFSGQLRLPRSVEAELRHRVHVQETISHE